MWLPANSSNASRTGTISPGSSRPNNRQSLYRIHILNAIFYSIIILLTEGSQKILAEMYALGLVASFTINMGSLLFYRYFTGTKEIRDYNTSRFGTLVLFVILLSAFVYLAHEQTVRDRALARSPRCSS